ncbi:hypothetical protein FRC07_014387, partial [Ceratobasidium sp. 392]
MHHIVTHIPEHTDDFGPAPQFWAYGSERLNRMLKNASTNRHAGGELEGTIANTHMHHQAFTVKLESLSCDTSDPIYPLSYLLRPQNSHRGTIESSRASYGAIEPSKQHSERSLEDGDHVQVTRHLQRMFPEHALRLSVRTGGLGPVVAKKKELYAFLIRSGRTFRAHSQNGIVLARATRGNQEMIECRGDLLEIFTHTHRFNDESYEVYFAKVRWYVDSTVNSYEPRPVRLWRYDAASLDIREHEKDMHAPDTQIIPFSNILGHCARMTVMLDWEPTWVTVSLLN